MDARCLPADGLVTPEAFLAMVLVLLIDLLDLVVMMSAINFFDAFRPPFLEALRFYFLARLEPLFLLPPDFLFTVTQARAFAFARDPTIFVALLRCVRPFVFAYRFKHPYLHEALSILLLLLVWPGDFLK